jgi:hypothetical protein
LITAPVVDLGADQVVVTSEVGSGDQRHSTKPVRLWLGVAGLKLADLVVRLGTVIHSIGAA